MMKIKEFIKHIRIGTNEKQFEPNSTQLKFINWLEVCKRKGLKPFNLKLRDKIR